MIKRETESLTFMLWFQLEYRWVPHTIFWRHPHLHSHKSTVHRRSKWGTHSYAAAIPYGQLIYYSPSPLSYLGHSDLLGGLSGLRHLSWTPKLAHGSLRRKVKIQACRKPFLWLYSITSVQILPRVQEW